MLCKVTCGGVGMGGGLDCCRILSVGPYRLPDGGLLALRHDKMRRFYYWFYHEAKRPFSRVFVDFFAGVNVSDQASTVFVFAGQAARWEVFSVRRRSCLSLLLLAHRRESLEPPFWLYHNSAIAAPPPVLICDSKHCPQGCRLASLQQAHLSFPIFGDRTTAKRQFSGRLSGPRTSFPACGWRPLRIFIYLYDMIWYELRATLKTDWKTGKKCI